MSSWAARARLGEVVDGAVADGASFDALVRISFEPGPAARELFVSAIANPRACARYVIGIR